MSFVLVFMGDPNRMNNPHLRARLAEALEFLKPPDGTSTTSTPTEYVFHGITPVIRLLLMYLIVFTNLWTIRLDLTTFFLT